MVGISTLLLPSAAAAASGDDGGTSSPVLFTASGSYTVPDGVTLLTVLAEGTEGGPGSPASFVADTDSREGFVAGNEVTVRRGTPGAGGAVTATVSVTPGETLDIVLGDSRSGATRTDSTEGGYSVVLTGGAGGRGIGIRRGGDWLVVAGGGGGAALGGYVYNTGNGSYFSETVTVGGDGGDVGQAGGDGAKIPVESNGGGGATAASAGAGGAGIDGGPVVGSGSAGGAPTSTALGVGGAAPSTRPLLGGGGGSGYYGGGGGASASPSDDSGGGGGGGSNFVNTGASVTLVSSGSSTRSLDDGPRLTVTPS